MAKLSESRRTALQLLGDIRRRQAYGRDLLRSSMRMQRLDERERAQVTRLVLGVTSASAQLDSIIDVHLKKRSSVEPRVRDALRLSVFEILHLSTPEPVAVSQGVELARFASPRAAGLANAVLHRVIEQECPAHTEARARLAAGEATDHDRVLVSALPEWLIAQIRGSITAENTNELCTAQLEAAPVWVHANAGYPDADTIEKRMQEAKLGPQKEALTGAYLLTTPAGLGSSSLVESVELVPSDLAAQLICAIALPETGVGIDTDAGTDGSTSAPESSTVLRLLEIGQGRATKSVVMLSLAKRLGLKLEHLGVDISPSKQKIASKRIERAGFAQISHSLALDGRFVSRNDVSDKLTGKFDAVLLDAPCSGTGTMRRHPEICWSLDEAALDPQNPVGLPALQLQMVKAAATRVKRGGSLCYATCSLLSQENDGIVDAFFESPEGEGFELAKVSKAPQLELLGARELIAQHEDERGFFRSVPKRKSCDGHFCARLLRNF